MDGYSSIIPARSNAGYNVKECEHKILAKSVSHSLAVVPDMIHYRQLKVNAKDVGSDIQR
eukprot:1362457-Ditylum_brightwellii.AAC.1